MISSYFNIVAHTMSQMFVRGVAEIAEALVAFRRLQNFLEYEEKDDLNTPLTNVPLNGLNNSDKDDVKISSKLAADEALLVENVTARWISMDKLEEKIAKSKLQTNGKSSPAPVVKNERPVETDVWKQATLDGITVRVKRGSLVGIVGAVGSGKTSFLQALMRELPLESGSIAMCGSVSYASQEPWVFAGSARQNILFGQEMERARYDAVVRACALVKDFEQFEFGDRTIIGERGTSLSGGQKARIK